MLKRPREVIAVSVCLRGLVPTVLLVSNSLASKLNNEFLDLNTFYTVAV